MGAAGGTGPVSGPGFAVYAVLALLAVALLWVALSTVSGWLALIWSWLPGHGDRWWWSG